MKKTLTLALCVLFTLCVLAGCGTADEVNSVSIAGGVNSTNTTQADDNVMGRYVQQDVTPAQVGDTRNTFAGLEDGSIALLAPSGKDGVETYTTTDGTEWQSVDTTAINEYIAANMPLKLFNYTIDAAGVYWVANFSPEGEIHLYRVSADGNGQEVHVPLLAEGAGGGFMVNYIEEIYAGNDGTMLLVLVNGQTKTFIQIDCVSGEVINTFSPPGYRQCYGYVNGKAYIEAQSAGGIEVFEATSGEIIATYQLPNGIEIPLGLQSVTVTKNETLCFATNAGITEIELTTGEIQNRIDNLGYAYAAGDFRPTDLLAGEDGSYLLACNEGGAGRVYRYFFDESVPANAANTLRVWAMQDNPLLREAISVFTRENLDYDVHMEYAAIGEESGQTHEDIIRTLITEILAGTGPDVLILDELPIYDMIAQGALVDLSGTVDKADYYENILEAYSQDGKDYAYPAAFRLPVLVKRDGTPGSPISGLTHITDLQDILANSQNVYFGGYSHLFNTFYPAFSPLIFPGGSGVDENAMREFFEVSSAIVNAHGIGTQEIDPITSNFVVGAGAGAGVVEIKYSPSITMYMGTYAMPQFNYAADVLNGFADFSRLDLDSSIPQLEPLPGSAFIPVCVAGVSATAQNAQAGKQFVATLLQCQTESVAGYLGLPGFLVRRGVELQRAVNYYNQLMAEIEDDEEYLPLDPTLVNWDALIEKYKTPANLDALLRDKIYEQARMLYSGTVSVEAAVMQVLNETQLYFAERQ